MTDNDGCLLTARTRAPWNKSKLIGAKPPLRPRHVWSIRTRLMLEGPGSTCHDRQHAARAGGSSALLGRQRRPMVRPRGSLGRPVRTWGAGALRLREHRDVVR